MAAPKGNKFAIGNSGKPKKWPTPELLQEAIDKYFKDTDDNPFIIDEYVGKEAIQVERKISRPYTVEGLCGVLGCDRMTLLNYKKEKGYEEYFGIINVCRRRVLQSQIEAGLAGVANSTVTKFVISNNSEYKDKKVNEHELGEGIKKIAFEYVPPKAEKDDNKDKE